VHEVEPTDAELVARIAAGDPTRGEAEAALCRRFAPRIRLYGLRHLRDESRADDLVQTVLLGLLQAARSGRIEDRDNTHRFVLGICRNSALRMRGTELRMAPATDEELERLAGAAAASVERVDLGRLVQCFDRLEERAKRVVMESFMEERSAAEIAEGLALSAVNVRVVRHRAVLALRRCLDLPTEGDAGGAS
jgi:RNA polymerase sigma-70 factor, ECF subfamily